MAAESGSSAGSSAVSSKHVLFYSNYCLYSKELLMTITKMDLRNRFILVCVEKHRASIPPLIDRVPTVVTPTKQLITDERVVPYVQSLRKGTGSHSQQAFTLNTPNAQNDGRHQPLPVHARHQTRQPTAQQDNVALAPKEVFSSSCTDFSYIGGDGGGESGGGGGLLGDGNGNDEEDMMVMMGGGSASYSLFGQEQRIETPADDDGEDEDSNADYERYKATRDADINSVVTAA